MKFIREHVSQIGRLLIIHFGIGIFSIVLNLTADKMWQASSLIFVSLVSIPFLAFLVYDMAWQAGSQDIVRMEAGRIPMDHTAGLKFSLVAETPDLLFCLLLVIGALVRETTGNADFFAIALFLAAFLWGSMYYGIMYFIAYTPPVDASGNGSLHPWLVVACYFVALFLVPLVSQIAYRNGQKNFRLFGKRKKPDSANGTK